MKPLRPALIRLARPHPVRAALGPFDIADDTPALGDDLRLFLTAWAGGLVFFGTFFS